MTGVIVFQGMKIGVLPGDFTVEMDESGSINSKLILSTAYNVLPIWIRIANDQLLEAKAASEAIAKGWGANDEANRELLIKELGPALQVFVACGIALDALYDQLRPFAKLATSDLKKWKENKTARAKQVTEVVRRVYGLDKTLTRQFRQNVSEILKYRDCAVHPSLELRQTCTRPDVPVGVDWKFSAYRYSNSAKCFKATLEMLVHLYGRKSERVEVVEQMEHVFDALEELKVVKRNARL